MVGIIILKTCMTGLVVIFTLSTSCSRPVKNFHTQAIEEPDDVKYRPLLTDSEASTANAQNESEAFKLQAANEIVPFPNDNPDIIDTSKDDNVCKGYIKKIEKDGFSVRVTTCNDEIREYDFKHVVAEIRPNPKYPYLAVYTSSLHDQYPEPGETIWPDELFIVNVLTNAKYAFRLKGSIEINFDLWSQAGDYAAFPGRGIEIVKTATLEKYLKTYKGAYRFVVTDKKRSPDDPSEIMTVAGWRSNTVLIINNGCCGFVWETEYDIDLDTCKRTACAYGYCMSTNSDHFETSQNDFVIKNGAATKYQVSTAMKRYFTYLDEHCSSLIDSKPTPKIAGDFFLKFTLNKDGKAVDPEITAMKTASPFVNELSFRNCILAYAEKLSFPPSEIGGKDTITVRITIVASR